MTNPLGRFQYAYVNTTGRIASLSYPNGQSTVYEYYNNAGDERLQQIQNLDPSNQPLSSFDYHYDAAGQIIAWDQNTGTPVSWNLLYDPADQLTGVVQKQSTTQSLLGSFAYTYDLAGNRTGEQVADPNNASGVVATTSTYNNLNQLTGRTGGGAVRFIGHLSKAGTVTLNGQPAATTVTGRFDGTLNLSPGLQTVQIQATDLGGSTASKRYEVEVAAAAAVSPGFDANGNLRNDGNGKAYTWDAANRLLTITQGSNVTGFIYDGLSRRVGETLNGALIKQWVWCGNAMGEERDANNNVTKRFYAQGEQLAGAAYYYTFDHLGSVRELTDSAGAVRARYAYDPYGRAVKTSGDLSADFQYTGDYCHAVSGLNLTLYRAYDSNLGRWLSRDPIAESGGINLYGYVGDEPIGQLDPLGESALETAALFGNWVTGTGDDIRNFGPGSDQVSDMQQAPGVQQARSYFRSKNQGAKCCDKLKAVIDFDVHFGLSGMVAAGFNSTRQFIGSYKVNIIPIKNGESGLCKIRILIRNTTSMSSFLADKGPSWERSPYLPTPGGNMRQIITWTESYGL